MLTNILSVASQILSLVYTVVQLAEIGGGSGTEKKAYAMAQFKALIDPLNIPAWAKSIVENEAVLSLLVDAMVLVLNKIAALLPKSGNAQTPA